MPHGVPGQQLGRAGAGGDRAGGVVRVCMYICVYVSNIYVYMYIRVCAKHARGHRLGVNPAPKEQEGVYQPASCAGLCSPWPLCPAACCRIRPALLAPSFPDPRRRVGVCQGWR